jgi:hypothetical protein
MGGKAVAPVIVTAETSLFSEDKVHGKYIIKTP